MGNIFFEANPNPMWIYEPDSLEIKAVNKAATVLYGYSGEEMRSLRITDLRPREEIPKLREEVSKRKQDFSDSGIWLHRKKNGDPIYVRILSYPIEWEETDCKLVVAQDVNEQEQNRLLLEAIMDQAESVITVKDAQGRYQLVNRKYCELLGLDEDEIIGSKEDEVFERRDTRIIQKVDEQIKKRGKVVETEEVLATEKGERTFVAVRYPLKNVPGYALSEGSIATEITDLKKARAELKTLYARELKERLRLERSKNRLELLEKVGDIFAGEQANHLSGVKKVARLLVEEVADICAFDLFEGEELKRIGQSMGISSEKERVVREIRKKFPDWFHNTAVLRQVTESGKPILVRNVSDEVLKEQAENAEQLALVRKLGIRSYFILPLKARGKVLGTLTLLITRDSRQFDKGDVSYLNELAAKMALHIENSRINEELHAFNRKLEEKVKERTLQLENTNEELESFSYSVSHDLRTPLRAISGYTSLLLEDHREQVDEEAERFLNIIHSETQRMGDLIDDLLSFSRLNRKEKVGRTFAMEPLVRECIDEVKKSYPEIEACIEVQKLPVVTGDPRLIRQVWINLIGNSFKYRKQRQPPRMEIGTRQSEQKDYTVFYVKDEGVGFNMKYADKLFGVFQRLHSDDEFEGTGIGLALVRRIINRHGGDVWAESKEGRGSTFYFSLPNTKQLINYGYGKGKGRDTIV